MPGERAWPDWDGFEVELCELINRHSLENCCNTPDWVMAGVAKAALLSLIWSTNARERSFGRDVPDYAKGPVSKEPKP